MKFRPTIAKHASFLSYLKRRYSMSCQVSSLKFRGHMCLKSCNPFFLFLGRKVGDGLVKEFY